MKHREPKLEVAIPSSTISVEQGEELRAYKVGVIGRLAAVFRVSTIHLYNDEPSLAGITRKTKKLLEYMLVAPYLRRHVFPQDPDLSYAGVLPPLQLATHGVKGPREGEVRQALLLSVKRGRIRLEAGLQTPLELESSRTLVESSTFMVVASKRIVHVLLESINPLRARLVSLEELARKGLYTGYVVNVHSSLLSLLRSTRGKCLVIATSRYGKPVAEASLDTITANASCILIVFGGPRRGLYDIAGVEGFRLEDYADLILNTIPSQGVLVVRTEEALAATLAILNLARLKART